MKITKLCLNLSIAVLGSIACSSMAIAGEGGSAASMSAIMTGGIISNISSASAIGKLNAAAATNSNQTETFATAYGSSGAIGITGAGTTGISYTGAVETSTSLGISQANTLAATAANINAKLGTVTIP